ncbi:hypothetical protein [Pyrinomonas methylaliphatogenes]|uniref:Uncharacterized protein n=1 Tax=Pyrinomonas methylaliphatogenes TaxID=454194 RepID=A0A0B6WTI1_9BACT|nr:hypothetical protein [Pyrinomonas methylaliphatogenes]CDM64346.1 hypothetical protein PYK22_00339 [Pyrinomonas methylaliphatogenes]
MNRFFQGGDLEKYLSFRCSQLIQEIEGLGNHCLVSHDENQLSDQLLSRYLLRAPQLFTEKRRVDYRSGEGFQATGTLTISVPFDGDATLLAFGLERIRTADTLRCEISDRELRLQIFPAKREGKEKASASAIIEQMQRDLRKLEEIAARYNDMLRRVVKSHLARLRQDLNFANWPAIARARRITARAI